MCGFAGFVDRNRRLANPQQTLSDMARALAHRGPDGEGFFSDDRFGLGMAFRRLAILDRSAQAQQPMKSAGGRWVIAYNGELWNYRELREQLQVAGSSFSSTGDTQVLAAALDAYGMHGALTAVDGMFAFAALDLQERALWLARDRFGVKPCLWGHAEDGKGAGVFVFGSDLRALVQCPVFRNRVNPFALAGMLEGLCVPGRLCVYQGVQKVQPGCAVRLDLLTGRVDELRWFDARASARTVRAAPFAGSPDEGVRVLEGLIDAAVQRRLAADVPVGAFLSGGIDSSLVVASMARSGMGGVKAFSVGFADPRFDERSHARAVAEALGVECIETSVDERDLPVLAEDVVTSFDEPFADSSALAALVAARLARSEVGVVLAGDGGDEFFAGYDRHVRGSTLVRGLEYVPGFMRRAMASGVDALAHGARARVMQKTAVLLRAEDMEHMWRGFFAAWANPAQLIVQLPSDAWRAFVARQIRQHERPFPDDDSGFRDEMLLRDQAHYLPDDLLVKLDRTTMACGLEAREPLLDRALFEFSWSVPAEWRTRGGLGKRMLRDVLARHVPGPLARRPKAGFAVPLQAWLAGPLREWTTEILGQRRLDQQGVFDGEPVRKAWARCQAGDESAAAQVWAVCMASRWCERAGVDGSRIAKP